MHMKAICGNGSCRVGENIPRSASEQSRVESWLRQLPLAPSTCAKLRSVMKVLFNHARRYDLFGRNPIELVRQSAKRRKISEILTIEEICQLLTALKTRELTLVLLALGTGLRKSELFALQWQDIDFNNKQIRVNDQSFIKWWASAKRRRRRSPCHFTLSWPKSCRIGIGRLAIERPPIGSLPAPTGWARSRTTTLTGPGTLIFASAG